MNEVVPFLWYDTQAEEAARFYVSLFPDSRIDQLTKEIDPYMERDFQKWDFGSYQKWQSMVEAVRSYAKTHPAKLKAEMKSYFKLSDEKMAELFPGD